MGCKEEETRRHGDGEDGGPGDGIKAATRRLGDAEKRGNGEKGARNARETETLAAELTEDTKERFLNKKKEFFVFLWDLCVLCGKTQSV